MPVSSLGDEKIVKPPQTAKFLHFTFSDGKESIRPSPIGGPVKDSTGRLNFYRPVPLNEKTSTEWRRKIGSKVAEMLGKPDSELYYLADWPKGYAFFDHNKQRDQGDMRHDPYLYGSPYTSKFRSTNEFVPHAFWLLSTVSHDNSECSCKYCQKIKGQTQVNETVLGIVSKPSSSKPAAPTVVPTQRRKAGRPSTNAEASSSKASHRAKFFKARFPLGANNVPLSGAYTLATRYAELHEGRFVRDGEMIWVRLPFPIKHPTIENMAIQCWPAFAEDYEYRKEINRMLDGTYTVSETLYIVTRPLMGGKTVLKTPESTTLPFRAWEIDEKLVDVIREVPLPPGFALSADSPLFEPRSCNGELVPGLTFNEAAPYYAMAVQTAVHMDLYWSPMFEVNVTIGRHTTAYFQGLWLGAERIWLDDIVRVLPSYEELKSHPVLRDQIFSSYQSQKRPIFMRINAISVVDILTPDGPRKACRVSGPLYGSITDPDYSLNPTDLTLMTPQESKEIPGIADWEHYPLPKPPIGFRYVKLTPNDQEATLDGGMIAGRYYPTLYLSSTLDMGWIQKNRQSWFMSLAALSGLGPAQCAVSGAETLVHQRSIAAVHSEAAAKGDLGKTLGADNITAKGMVNDPRSFIGKNKLRFNIQCMPSCTAVGIKREGQ